MDTLELMHRISRNARDQHAAVDTIKLIWPNAKVGAHIDTARPKDNELCLVVDVGDYFAFPVLCIEHNCRTCDSYA